MAGYLPEAQRHAEKIDYFYKHAGTRGYSQALYHLDEIASLAIKAQNSEKYREEVPVIHGIMKSMQEMMDKMKLLADADD